jgi:ubiquinone/menaquinone biosynthesis C-methylase UbiE
LVTAGIDEKSVGERYGTWLTRGLQGAVMRYLFSPRGLWLINTPYKRILAAAAITAEDQVLDLGCGTAPILISLQRMLNFRTPPVGVDISAVMIELARRELERAGMPGKIELRVAPATGLPFEDRRFDVVISSHMIKHLDDEAMASTFREVARVLKPGGRFLLWEFKATPRSAPVFWTARASRVPPPFRLRSQSVLREALRAAGFAQAEAVRAGIFLLPPVPRTVLLATRSGIGSEE